MKDFNCVLDYKYKVAHIGNESVDLFLQSPDTIAVVQSESSHIIPPMSEMVVQAYTAGNLRCSDDLLVSAEPSLHQNRQLKLMVATCLVPRDNVFRIKVMNLSEHPVQLSRDDVHCRESRDSITDSPRRERS